MAKAMRLVLGILFCELLGGCALLKAQEWVGPPISENDFFIMVRHIQYFGEDRLIEMVEKRGVAFPLSDATRRRLKHAGAGEPLLNCVDKKAGY